MAVIPRLERRVAPEVQQATRVAQPNTDLSGLARGFSNLGGTLSDIAHKEQQDANQTALINADNQLGTWQNQALFNPDNGAFTRKGSGALGLTQNVLADYDKQQQTVYESLANDDQKRLFQQSAVQRRSGLEAKLGGYEFQQQQEYKDDVDKSSMQLSIQSAALNYGDPDAIEQSRSKMQGVLQLRAQRNGWSPEELQAQTQTADSQLYSGVISQMAGDDPYKAKQFFEKTKASMTAQDIVQAGNSIDVKIERLEQRAEMNRLRAEARADRALSKINNQIASGVPATDGMWKAWESQIRGTPAQAEFNELRGAEVETQKVLRQPIDQQISYINLKSAELQNNGGTLTQASNLQRLSRAVEENGKMMADAPLNYFQQRLGGDVQPIDLNSEDLPTVLNDRVSAIQSMQQKYGSTVAMKPLLPQEAKAITAQLDQMTPEQQSQMFGKLHSAMGDTQAYAGAMQQIAADSPVRALTGMLAGKQREITTNTHWFKPDDVATGGDIAKTMALGESILNKSKGAKEGDGNTRFPIPKQTDFDLAIDKRLSGVFAGQPQAYGLASQAIKAYYTGAAAESGNISGELDKSVMDRAIKATVGEVVDFNNSQVLAPWGMPADTFETLAKQRLVQTMQAQGMSERDISSADALTLRQYKDGVYYVMQGQQFKYGSDGKPMTISVNGDSK